VLQREHRAGGGRTSTGCLGWDQEPAGELVAEFLLGGPDWELAFGPTAGRSLEEEAMGALMSGEEPAPVESQRAAKAGAHAGPAPDGRRVDGHVEGVVLKGDEKGLGATLVGIETRVADAKPVAQEPRLEVDQRRLRQTVAEKDGPHPRGALSRQLTIRLELPRQLGRLEEGRYIGLSVNL
jgi:hypothetical protein